MARSKARRLQARDISNRARVRARAWSSATRCSTPRSSPARPAYATVAGILADWKTAEGALKKAAAGAAKSRAKRQPLAQDQIAGAGAVPADHLLRRRQLRRPCRGDGAQAGHAGAARSARAGPKAVAFHQGRPHHHRSRRDRQSFALRQGPGLGNRTCRGHRPAGQGRAAGQGAELRRRLHGRQRLLRPRPRPPARRRRRPRFSRWTGPSTRASTAPARSGRGSCRRATSPIRRSSG